MASDPYCMVTTLLSEISSFADEPDDNDDYDELLINEVKSYRCIWDTKCHAFKEAPKKNEAWKIIAFKLSRPGRY